MSRLSSHVAIALPIVLMLPMIACGPSSPEGKIAKIREGYKIELNSWRAKAETPPPMGEVLEVASGEESAVAEEVATAEENATAEEGAMGEDAAAEMEAGPQTRDILFDLVVYFRGTKSLDGVTVEVTQAGGSQAEKATFHHYVETKGIVNGETRQYDFVMEGVPFEEGDIFSVELVEGVPADPSQYREFSEPAP